MSKTTILEPFNLDDFIKNNMSISFQGKEPDVIKKEVVQNLKTRLKKIKSFLNDVDLNSEETFLMTFEVFLERLEMSEKEYLSAVSYSLKRPQVFLKRALKEIRVNNYNKMLLETWVGNMVIQFILDPYSVCMYVVNYIGKSFRGMS